MGGIRSATAPGPAYTTRYALSERGGCHKCLAVAFGCERFNTGLDRGYLVGGGRLAIREGFLHTAARLATP